MVKTTQTRHKFPKGNNYGNRFTSDKQPTPQAKSNGIKKVLSLKAIAKMLGEGRPAEKIVAEYKKIFPEIDEKQMTQDVALIMGQYHKGIVDRDTSAARYITELKGEAKAGVEVIAPIQITFNDERFKKL